jgi:hypothetical protein
MSHDIALADHLLFCNARRKNHVEKGLSANIEFEEADFFQDQPAHRAGQVDVYFVRRVLHDWP